MSDQTCQWVLLPAADDSREGPCGAPVVGDFRYCAVHQREVDYTNALDKKWQETEATRELLREKPKAE